MNRRVLSVFNAVRFINSAYTQPQTLWRTVREELQAFRGLMIFLHADWARSWNPYVTTTDSSLQGYRVVSFWPSSTVAEVGRLQERSRAGSHSARESALTAAGFVKDEYTQAWKAGWFDDAEDLHMSGWGLEKDFKEVPSHMLCASLWSACFWGRWDYEANNILELQAPALVKGPRRIALHFWA